MRARARAGSGDLFLLTEAARELWAPSKELGGAAMARAEDRRQPGEAYGPPGAPSLPLPPQPAEWRSGNTILRLRQGQEAAGAIGQPAEPEGGKKRRQSRPR